MGGAVPVVHYESAAELDSWRVVHSKPLILLSLRSLNQSFLSWLSIRTKNSHLKVKQTRIRRNSLCFSPFAVHCAVSISFLFAPVHFNTFHFAPICFGCGLSPFLHVLSLLNNEREGLTRVWEDHLLNVPSLHVYSKEETLPTSEDVSAKYAVGESGESKNTCAAPQPVSNCQKPG